MGEEPTREKQLRLAIESARLPPRDYRIYMALLWRADWETAVIPSRFQPRSLRELAAWSQISKANVVTGCDHLHHHHWLRRWRHLTDQGIGGRSHPTSYQLDIGEDCDCKASRSKTVPEVAKASRSETDPSAKVSKNRALKCPDDSDVSAGQSRVSAERAARGGDRGEGPPETGYTGGPVPWSDDDLEELADLAPRGICAPAVSAPSLGAALTLTIGDRTRPAIICAGCGELCWAHVSFAGRHASC